MNVFSLGMDQIAYKLEAAGVASSVNVPHAVERRADDRCPVQGRATRTDHPDGPFGRCRRDARCPQTPRGTDIPVALIVNFDPVAPDAVPNNVKQIVNYYVPAGWGRAVSADPRFKGKLANVNENATATLLDRQGRQPAASGQRVMAVTGGGIRRKPAALKPARTSRPSAIIRGKYRNEFSRGDRHLGWCWPSGILRRSARHDVMEAWPARARHQ